ncbi:tRNA (cytosine(38)-C(5))-methyltransferase [Platysternon megacephalum]|uniref:tRNA (Cytosine(38)-C(5))-methyltransferase n=1 Tax=Platysternon megacephalum TaxID=55544 RepID=A0A4D9EDZ6_9SAUR|nr:tRNA (cytosine(38)-C(5))-methyltransferase [Platysternon megacephalum]
MLPTFTNTFSPAPCDPGRTVTQMKADRAAQALTKEMLISSPPPLAVQRIVSATCCVGRAAACRSWVRPTLKWPLHMGYANSAGENYPIKISSPQLICFILFCANQGKGFTGAAGSGASIVRGCQPS